jgi:hypothetical protein
MASVRQTSGSVGLHRFVDKNPQMRQVSFVQGGKIPSCTIVTCVKSNGIIHSASELGILVDNALIEYDVRQRIQTKFQKTPKCHEEEIRASLHSAQTEVLQFLLIATSLFIAMKGIKLN